MEIYIDRMLNEHKHILVIASQFSNSFHLYNVSSDKKAKIVLVLHSNIIL